MTHNAQLEKTGQDTINQAKAEKHHARAAQHKLEAESAKDSDVKAYHEAEALRETGKEEIKIGKIAQDEFLIQAGHEKKLAGETISRELEGKGKA